MENLIAILEKKKSQGRFVKGSIGNFARKKAHLTAEGCKVSHKTIYAQKF